MEVDEVYYVVDQSSLIRMEGCLIDSRNVVLAPKLVEACLDGHAEFQRRIT